MQGALFVGVDFVFGGELESYAAGEVEEKDEVGVVVVLGRGLRGLRLRKGMMEGGGRGNVSMRSDMKSGDCMGNEDMA